MSGRFQVLALDGGGVKALFTAWVLARLEEDLGVEIREHFDLIVGTSAGGLIALALGAGLRPADIVERYQELSDRVFPRRGRLIRKARAAARPQYDADVLRDALERLLGSRRLEESEKPLVVPAYDLGGQCVHVFKTPHHSRFRRDGRVSMVDVAAATSAAPAYFRAADLEGVRLVDGGVWANNPSVVGIAEALSVFDQPLSAIRLLNIGTMTSREHRSRKLDRAGWARWATSAPLLFLEAQSKGTAGTAERLLPTGAFHRFDALIPSGRARLDAADARDVSGDAYRASRKLCPTFEATFVDHHTMTPQTFPVVGPLEETP